MPRFALLRHDSPRGLHWDLLLETGSLLRTWELPGVLKPNCEMFCRALPDHRPVYLDYEGPVSGGRGTVVRQESGTFRLLSATADELIVELQGQSVSGRLTLQLVDQSSGKWRLHLEGAQEARE